MDRRLTTSLFVAAVASAGAGMLHAAAAGSHGDDAAVAWMFSLCAVAQLGWAVLVVTRPTRLVLVAGAVLNAACVGAWALSRTVGLVGPLEAVEEVGAQDLVAAALAACATGAALLALRPARTTAPPRSAGRHRGRDPGRRRHRARDGRGSRARPRRCVAPSTTSPPLRPSRTTSTPAEAAPRPRSTRSTRSTTAPIVSLADARLTSGQRLRATNLLESTREVLRTQFPDRQHVEAAGYGWIGDGRRVGGYLHFVNQSYLADGQELDPQHIESIVLQRQPDGSEKVVTAMYILTRGTTLADAPDIAGSLTPWHDHQNLCWDETGTKLAGIVVDGQCRPGGTFRATAPMMHVWLTNPPCGPFSGVEGHGAADCAHTHAPA